MVSPNIKRGFTLAEMMLTLALVALVYTMISTILIQISRYVRAGREVARERHQLLKTVEDLRYQLRSLYYPSTGAALSGLRTPIDGRDTLRFATTNGRIHKGVVEVAYKIEEVTNQVSDEVSEQVEEEDLLPALYYREFPFRRPELRSLEVHQEAPWKVYLRNVKTFELEYTSSGDTWQTEWEEPGPPRRVRIRLARGGESRDSIVFDVTPGIGAPRW